MEELKLLRQDNQPKTQISMTLYTTTLAEFQKICEKENVKMTHLLRHFINDFIERYKKNGKEVKK